MSPFHVLCAVPDRDADAYYFGGFKAMGVMLMMGTFDAPVALAPRLETGRAAKEGRFAEVLDLTTLLDEMGAEGTPAKVVARLCLERGVSEVVVPAGFPAGMDRELVAAGLNVVVQSSPLFPQRWSKSASEIEGVTRGCRIAEAGLEQARRVLRQSVIRSDSFLEFEGEVLTSERLRREISVACVAAGGAIVSQPIAAGGLQAADCHHLGEGPLRAHEMIVVDVFPRDSDSYYYGDLTRTYVKGRPTPEQERVHAAVLSAHQAAIKMFAPAADLSAIDRTARTILEEAGFPTRLRPDGKWEGTYCGIGHGVGLDIHEPPFMAKESALLEPGMVMTLEPGLYLPDLGGCRIEDMILITGTGAHKMNATDYEWVIP